MSKTKPSWFVTQAGRNFSFGLSCVASVGAFSAHWLPHGFFLDKYKKFVHMYMEGLEAPLDPRVKKIAHQALKDCNLPERSLLSGVDFFCVSGVDVFYAGSSYLKWGIIIGIPRHFAYRSTDDVEKQQLRVREKSIDWESPAGKTLLNALVLSDRAQKFAIARQIHRANTLHPVVNGAFGSFGVVIAYIMGRYLNERTQGYNRSRLFRFSAYSICASIGYWLFVMLKDSTSLYWDRKADDNVIAIGPDYLKGGIEFYEKMLRRNRALRELLGDIGKKVFTIQGNESVFIRTKTLPLTERLDYLRDKELEAESQ